MIVYVDIYLHILRCVCKLFLNQPVHISVTVHVFSCDEQCVYPSNLHAYCRTNCLETTNVRAAHYLGSDIIVKYTEGTQILI